MDLYDPEAVLEAAEATLDLSRPVALMILNTLGHVGDYEQARDLVRRLMAGLPSGSHLVISDTTATSEGMVAASEAYNASGAVPYHVRAGNSIGSGGTALAVGRKALWISWFPEPQFFPRPGVR